MICSVCGLGAMTVIAGYSLCPAHAESLAENLGRTPEAREMSTFAQLWFIAFWKSAHPE